MADHISIKGIEPYDGDYDFDAGYFTNRELHTIKRLAGIRAGELGDALNAGDSDLMVSLAVICLARHGKVVDEDLIWDGQAGSIVYVGDDEVAEDDVVPPAQPSGDESSSAADVKNDSSGLSGTNGSDSPLPSDRNVIGRVSSVASVTSGQSTLGT